MRPLALLLALATTVFSGCGRHSPPASLPDSPAVDVRTARVESVSLPITRTLTATVHPLERATLAARVMGSVTGATFIVGQNVSAGELLLTLHAPEVPARLAQARAVLAQAERESARETDLVKLNAAAADSARAAADRRQLAQAAVTEAEALLAYTRITAPFAGTITRKLVNTGDLALPGAPLLDLEATDHLRAEVQVPAALASVPLGSTLVISPGPESAPTATASLAEFSAAADPVTRTRLAQLDLPAAASFRSGQLVRVLWPTGENSTVLLVPTRALSVLGPLERVFVVHAGGRAQLRLVKSAGPQGESTVILSGLTAGETIIVDPAPALRDGQPVNVRP